VTSVVPSGSPTDTGDDKNSVKVRLPKLNLPAFDGNILYWQEFGIFLQPQFMSMTSQFSYLKSSLHAAAASAISGISVTNDNYN